MQRLGCQYSECRGTFWCPRCGSLLIKFDAPAGGEDVARPALVERCREFEDKSIAVDSATYYEDWRQMGLAEAIRLPGERRKMKGGGK